MKTAIVLLATAATAVRAANLTIAVVPASTPTNALGTVERDFPTAPCPAYNGVVLSDGLDSAISAKYSIACDHALDGQNYQTVEENGSTSGVSIIDCLSTCDWYAATETDGCCGAIIDPDGVCQLVTGTCYSLSAAAGYDAFNYEGLSS